MPQPSPQGDGERQPEKRLPHQTDIVAQPSKLRAPTSLGRGVLAPGPARDLLRPIETVISTVAVGKDPRHGRDVEPEDLAEAGVERIFP